MLARSSGGLRRRSAVSTADEEVSILGLLRRLDVFVPDVQPGKSHKIYCPFGHVHIDHGLAKAMRVYPDTNSCYCFAGCGYFRPSSLAAQAWDVSVREAAERLLEEIGYQEPTAERETEARLDFSALSEALRMYCSSFPGWDVLQYDSAVASALDRCLALLPAVSSADEAREWLEACKLVMKTSISVVSTNARR